MSVKTHNYKYHNNKKRFSEIQFHIRPPVGDLGVSISVGKNTNQIRPLFMMQVLPSLAQRPTWPQRWQEATDRAPRQMCGAAAACCCTCSTVATRGHATTPTRSVCRWERPRSREADVHLRDLKNGTLTVLVHVLPQIVNEPPPLWEVPSYCNNFTAKVFRAGLQKEPERRASAKELRRKGTKALRAGQVQTSQFIM